MVKCGATAAKAKPVAQVAANMDGPEGAWEIERPPNLNPANKIPWHGGTLSPPPWLFDDPIDRPPGEVTDVGNLQEQTANARSERSAPDRWAGARPPSGYCAWAKDYKVKPAPTAAAEPV